VLLTVSNLTTLLSHLAQFVPLLTLNVLPSPTVLYIVHPIFVSAFTATFAAPCLPRLSLLYFFYLLSFSLYSGQRIKTLRVDNAPELVHGKLQHYCSSRGITYEKTILNSPSQNSVAERCNLTLASMARAMLLDAPLCSRLGRGEEWRVESPMCLRLGRR
jgi:hypothetical protein